MLENVSVVAPSAGRPRGPGPKWGRALGRDVLDTMLLNHARSAGVDSFQPCVAEHLQKSAAGFLCRTKMTKSGECEEFEAPVVIAAHGSWEPGNLPSQHPQLAPEPSHLFGFKAHLAQAELPAGLMPLLAFPGGYGGLVHSPGGLVSLSCCIRRDVPDASISRVIRERGRRGAHAHILETCPAVRAVLRNCQLADKWLSAGPIRPGIRDKYRDGIFRVGNAAGEAHPAVAEGIGMAMQSAWLLAESLPGQAAAINAASLQKAGREYSRRWRQTFVPRIRAAGFFANLAMRPHLANAAAAVLNCVPSMLALCAAWSGKSDLLFSVREAGYIA